MELIKLTLTLTVFRSKCKPYIVNKTSPEKKHPKTTEEQKANDQHTHIHKARRTVH